ncbi:MAG TPA: ABC transporter permease [Opitutaceae bacterium]|nr:ABC transporter permease [Opitutaceae bacterium]
MSKENTDFEIFIRPNQGWFNIDWKGLRDYRDLLILLVRRDFVSKYQQTVLGPLWFIINPLITTVVFTLVFGRVVGISTDEMNPTLFYMSGLVCWSYFSSVLSSTANTFTGNAHLFGKVYFPRLIVPLAMSVSHLFTFTIQLCTFTAIFVLYHFTGKADGLAPSAMLFMLPIYIVHTALLALGVGMALSALTAKYRDFHHLSNFLVQLWMYATPIIYPLSSLLKKLPHDWQWLGVLNPMTMVVEAMRFSLMGKGTFSFPFYGISFGISVLMFFVGLMLFQRAARTFVDTV